jgi:hypothetical protein
LGGGFVSGWCLQTSHLTDSFRYLLGIPILLFYVLDSVPLLARYEWNADTYVQAMRSLLEGGPSGPNWLFRSATVAMDSELVSALRRSGDLDSDSIRSGAVNRHLIEHSFLLPALARRSGSQLKTEYVSMDTLLEKDAWKVRTHSQGKETKQINRTIAQALPKVGRQYHRRHRSLKVVFKSNFPIAFVNPLFMPMRLSDAQGPNNNEPSTADDFCATTAHRKML